MNRNGLACMSTIAPPTPGPRAGASDITIEILPIIRPRDSGGTSVITVVIKSGIITAVPDA